MQEKSKFFQAVEQEEVFVSAKMYLNTLVFEENYIKIKKHMVGRKTKTSELLLIKILKLRSFS